MKTKVFGLTLWNPPRSLSDSLIWQEQNVGGEGEGGRGEGGGGGGACP